MDRVAVKLEQDLASMDEGALYVSYTECAEEGPSQATQSTLNTRLAPPNDRVDQEIKVRLSLSATRCQTHGGVCAGVVGMTFDVVHLPCHHTIHTDTSSYILASCIASSGLCWRIHSIASIKCN